MMRNSVEVQIKKLSYFHFQNDGEIHLRIVYGCVRGLLVISVERSVMIHLGIYN